MRPRREPNRNNDYAYFVSTQTIDRKPFFRHDRWARLLMATLDHYGTSDFVLHAYVVMPDHLHFLITPSVSVEKSVQLIKGGFSFRAKRELDWKGEIWQPGFTDQRTRDEEDWQHHLDYIRQNPVRARLVEDAVLYQYMNFPNMHFPRGLKPSASGDRDVRAEARTLQSEPPSFVPHVEAHVLQQHPGQKLQNDLKGTGFSPSITPPRLKRALAPEGGK